MALRKENAKIWDNVPNGFCGLKNKQKSPNFNLGIVKPQSPNSAINDQTLFWWKMSRFTRNFFGEKCRDLRIIFGLKMSRFTHHFSGRVYAFQNLHLGKVWLFDVICSPLRWLELFDWKIGHLHVSFILSLFQDTCTYGRCPKRHQNDQQSWSKSGVSEPQN